MGGEKGGTKRGRGEGESENEEEDKGEGKGSMVEGEGRESRVISWWRRGSKDHKIGDFTNSAEEHGAPL